MALCHRISRTIKYHIGIIRCMYITRYYSVDILFNICVGWFWKLLIKKVFNAWHNLQEETIKRHVAMFLLKGISLMLSPSGTHTLVDELASISVSHRYGSWDLLFLELIKLWPQMELFVILQWQDPMVFELI